MTYFIEIGITELLINRKIKNKQIRNISFYYKDSHMHTYTATRLYKLYMSF